MSIYLQDYREFMLVNPDAEVCGVLTLMDPDFFVPTQVSVSTERGDRGRRMCMQVHDDYIFHTHPISSYAYPSFEDINKVTKRNKIRLSMIFTYWGVWIIHKQTPEIEDMEYLRDEIESLGHDLVRSLRLPNRQDGDPRTVTYNELPHEQGGVRSRIDRYIRAIRGRIRSATLYFTPWERRDTLNLTAYL